MPTRMTEDGMMAGAVVVVSLNNPKERVWGQMMSLNPAGITARVIDLNAFDDFIRQVKDAAEEPVGLPSVFYPMHRIERIALDEERGGVPSLAQTFEQQVGQTLEEYLNSL
jgi:hypothetical protein